MSISRKLKEYLETIPAIADKLSAPGWGVRIRKDSIPEGMPLPYVRLAASASHPDYHLGGELADKGAFVQCDVWAETEAEADEIAELIRLAPLSGFHGVWTSPDGTTTQIKGVSITTEMETFEDPKDGSDDMRYRNVKDYRIHYERPVT